jgi:hypothetical protein
MAPLETLLYQEVTEPGWGFCSSDCYLGEIRQEEAQSVLREVKGVDVLPADVCDEFLKEAVGPKGVEVMPKILCLGSYRPWRTQVWKRTQGRFPNRICGSSSAYKKIE